MNPPLPDARLGCPGRDTLVGFDQGQLAEVDLESIAGHLATCSLCEANLARVRDEGLRNTLHHQLRRCLALPTPPVESGLARMLAVVEDLTEERAEAPTAADTARPTVAAQWVGRTIGNYEVVGRLGEGGMGVVYRARQMPLGREVALKVLVAGVHAPEHLRGRFRTEGTAVARLHHPHVVQIHDFGEHEGLLYYSMELIEGGSLQARLRQGPLEFRAAAELVRTLAEALEFAHQKQVLHRDLKPGNVLLAANGTPKISDFGLAKLLDADIGQTHSSAVLGTPPYMAPEQADGRMAEVGPAADVYALGAILYAALTGHPPFQGENSLRTLELVRTAEPLPPSRLRAGVPRGLDDVCLKCLQKQPARRYPSARALADDLARWLRQERPQATPGAWRRIGDALRRRAALIVAGLAVLGAAAVYLGWLALPDRQAADVQPLERLESDLDAGRPVTLIGPTGPPAWSRWRMAEGRSQLSLTEGCFTVSSWSLALLELLPDPRHDRYRLAAQVRHGKSIDFMGEVGLFVARQAYPGGDVEIHFFLRTTFNDVQLLDRGDPPRKRLPRDNTVTLRPHLHSEQDRPPAIDRRLGGATGPRFKPAGEERGGWHPIEVVVTPEQVAASWHGQAFSLTAGRLRDIVQEEMAAMRPVFPPGSFVQRLRPTFAPRGGLGLYVFRGSASFRAVTVTPLFVKP
jgi:serine/threonine-protein kinase